MSSWRSWIEKVASDATLKRHKLSLWSDPPPPHSTLAVPESPPPPHTHPHATPGPRHLQPHLLRTAPAAQGWLRPLLSRKGLAPSPGRRVRVPECAEAKAAGPSIFHCSGHLGWGPVEHAGGQGEGRLPAGQSCTHYAFAIILHPAVLHTPLLPPSFGLFVLWRVLSWNGRCLRILWICGNVRARISAPFHCKCSSETWNFPAELWDQIHSCLDPGSVNYTLYCLGQVASCL